MKFVTNIILLLVLPMFVGMCIIGGITIGVIFAQSPDWINRMSDTIQKQARDGFVARAITQASSVNAAFSSYLISTHVAATYIRDVLNLPGTTPDTRIVTNKAYPSYFAAQLGNPPVDPPLPPSSPIPGYSTYSAYYRTSIATLNDFTSFSATDNTTTFDNPFRAITLSNPATQVIQAGFEDNGWRVYPYTYDLKRFDPRTSASCSSPDAPSALAGYVGYNPRCRPWYTAAVAAGDVQRDASLASGLGPTVLSPPYVSRSFGNGGALITASQAFYDAKGVAGVVGLQIQVSTLNQQLTNSTVLTRGYMFIVDTNGYLVLYPTNRGINPFINLTKLSTAEFASTDAAGTAFVTLAVSSASQGGAALPFNRRTLARSNATAAALLPDEDWTVSASTIASTNGTYLLCVVVPSSDISALSDSMRKDTNMYARVALGAALAAVLVAAAVAFVVTWAIARRVLVPVEELTGWLTRVSQSNMEEEVAEANAASHELRIVKQNFKHLLTAIRFGNEAYYANDLAKALANYEAAEQLMVQLKNERGRGVCLNNKGNVYKQLDEQEITRAVEAYRVAIDIAESLLSVETDPTVTTTLRVTLAHRLSNLGVVYKDSEVSDTAEFPTTPRPMTPRQERARALFQRALDLHRSADNLEGIAQASGNLGQLYLETGWRTEAAELLSDAYDIVKSRNDPVALQHACMNMGLLAAALGRPAEAVTWFTYVLQRFDTCVAMVQRTCAAEIVRMCEERDLTKGVDRPEIARAIRDVAEPVFGDIFSGPHGGGGSASSRPKDIHFVLDCSGSMAGAFIRACRVSIETIITTDCRGSDRVALTTFSNAVRDVFELTPRGGADAAKGLVEMVKSRTPCDGATAFYDAVVRAVRKAGAAAASSTRDVWVVALTDGDDNASSTTAEKVAQEIRTRHRDVGVIVIAVGRLGNEGKIREIVAAAGKGFLVKAEQSSESIREAFGKVSKMIVGNLRVESL
ncbi:hypothetical protein HDU96_007767 [Phlyctochytrium bullatum]|nr:hypothetical protein HDU96_007767 [Phlyctochytrium bullatum]